MSGGAGLRVTGGRLKGRKLVAPPKIRPTGARLREALMSIWGGRLAEARILDLYAGSGAVGIEALSRGAASAVFVENGRGSLAALRRNLELVDRRTVELESGEAGIVLARLRRRGARFDLLFADPPYDLVPTRRLLAALRGVACAGALLAFEHRSGVVPEEQGSGWTVRERRSYGDATISLYEASDVEA